eukprot:3979096-Pyramimonas_sp.AAC.1
MKEVQVDRANKVVVSACAADSSCVRASTVCDWSVNLARLAKAQAPTGAKTNRTVSKIKGADKRDAYDAHEDCD